MDKQNVQTSTNNHFCNANTQTMRIMYSIFMSIN